MTQQPNPPLGGDEAKVVAWRFKLAGSNEWELCFIDPRCDTTDFETVEALGPLAAPVLPVERPFGLSPLEQERIRSGLIAGLEKAYWAGSEINTDFDALTEADAILSTIKGDA